MTLRIYASNRMERLIEKLGDTVSTPLSTPLAPETIVVQSRGMQRWISIGLAERLGVWGNCSYPFPNLFVSRIFEAFGVEPSDYYDPEFMRWRVMRLLDQSADSPRFAGVKRYLSGVGADMKRYQLAGKIADCFDQYTLFRGDILESWEKGESDDWQALLWRALVAECGKNHRASSQKKLLALLAGDAGEIRKSGKIPERISIFGISYLPPFHLEIIAAIARHTEIFLFILSPCREYWGDISGRRGILKSGPAFMEETPGNTLLASLGRMGRDFSNLLLEYDEASGGADDLYEEIEPSSLLEVVQMDILNLQEADRPSEKKVPRTGISFHSCHGALREMEVLRDNLLEMFRLDPTLEPRDVLVLNPDIESSAGYIEAVFGAASDSGPAIPYSIADTSYRTDGRLTPPLLAILELSAERFSAPAVIEILSSDSVSARFGFSLDEAGKCEKWIAGSMIRWGLDENDRLAEGFPAYRENSWEAGFDRLLLGYAMPEAGASVFDGMLPYDRVDGSDYPLMGRLITFVRLLHARIAELEEPCSLAQWAERLTLIFTDFFSVEDKDAEERREILSIIGSILALQEKSGFYGKVPLELIRSWLAASLAAKKSDVRFLSGGVTFCSMLPMRSIPFRIIALTGMNDSAFPRRDSRPGFDITGRGGRRGDRSLRDEDRYLFLETILSARDQLYISYTGQSVSDNSKLPPSVLVSELQDYLAERYCGAEVVSSLLTLHRLQPFAFSYFDPSSPLFSYSAENFDALAGGRRGIREEKRSFFRSRLSIPPESMLEVTLKSLVSFYRNPSAFLLRKRLGISLEPPLEPLPKREPLGIDPFDSYLLKEKLLEFFLEGADQAKLKAFARSTGLLPPARQGDALFQKSLSEVEKFASFILDSFNGEKELEPREFVFETGDFRVTGILKGARPTRLTRYRPGKKSAKDQISVWIEHLFLNILPFEDFPKTTRLITSDGVTDLSLFPSSEKALQNLLECYREGLAAPLKFFPRSTFAYLKTGKIEAARKAWRDERNPEASDPAFAICFGDSDPFDSDFTSVAERTFSEYFRGTAGRGESSDE